MGESQPLNGMVQALVNSEVSAAGTPGRQVRRSNGKDLRFFDLLDLFGKRFTRRLHLLSSQRSISHSDLTASAFVRNVRSPWSVVSGTLTIVCCKLSVGC